MITYTDSTRLSPARPMSLWKVAGLAFLVLGAGALTAYSVYFENRPGEIQPAPKRWPIASHLSRDETIPTLVVFLHPECQCSEATYTELSKILEESNGPLRTYAVIAAYGELASDSTLVHKVKTNSSITISTDPEKIEQLAFGAKTSGLVLLYDKTGALAFEGGITGRRGHVGENHGSQAIKDFLAGKPLAQNKTSVFGCHL